MARVDLYNLKFWRIILLSVGDNQKGKGRRCKLRDGSAPIHLARRLAESFHLFACLDLISVRQVAVLEITTCLMKRWAGEFKIVRGDHQRVGRMNLNLIPAVQSHSLSSRCTTNVSQLLSPVNRLILTDPFHHR